ncbi:MAG TPA: hypothetical protein VMM27_05445 [Casimicrobiaceae bacterium]|nr:hypothetical protein [Casimicrobiaceae bacterium]
MRTYRIVTRDGVELATVQATSIAQVIAMEVASAAPVGARIVALAEGPRQIVLASRELWAEEFPGWAVALAHDAGGSRR